MVEIIICTTKDDIINHFLIRKIVFVLEQNVSMEEEFDLEEKDRVMFLVNYNNIPVGAARLKFTDSYSKIERVCILKEYRNKGIGKVLIEEMVKYSFKNYRLNIHLGSQTHAIKFYNKCGFKQYGELYYDANIPHFNMKKEL